MKFLTFKHNHNVRFGWLLEDQKTIASVDPKDQTLPQSLIEVAESGVEAQQALIAAHQNQSFERFNIDEIEFLEPLVPGAIVCVGLNYSDHAAEVGKELTDHPTIFFRLARSHVPHKQAIYTPNCSDTLDWEGELAVIIGKGGRHISAVNAKQHIFGYSIYNEGSVRRFQRHSTQFGLGKNFQASGAFGPVVVTADEFGDPYQHHIQTRIDNEVVQSASISNMLHSIEKVIAYLSTAMVLQAGDVICTGTPSGVGVARNPRRFLKHGETVEVEISGIGTLTNPVLDELNQEAVL